MKPLMEPFASVVAGRPAEIELRGSWLLGDRLLSKGLAFREDEPRPSFSNEEILSNAPDAEAGCFRVPKVIEA